MFRLLGFAAGLAVALALGVAAAGADSEPKPLAPEPRPPRLVQPPPPRPKPPARAVVARFTTRYTPGEPRVTNIRRAAELLDGWTIPAGGTFSLNPALGERTVERGFVPAPMILNGRFVDSVGGGVSQVATALYNAAFFAGLELVEHTPHSIYIDRYPPGREATVSWGGPELVFRNDWDAPLRMRLSTTAQALTVRFISEPLGRRVETETVVDGLDVRYTRRVYRRDRLVRDERFRTRYQPRPAER